VPDPSNGASARLGCCGGSRDPVKHRDDCPSIVRAALSWIEETNHGERQKMNGERAFDLILAERDSLREQIALCAADTTAADLAQDIEFLKAERARMQERLAASERDLTALPGEGNPDDDIDFAWRPFKVIPPPPSDGCRTCHRPWTECVC
jgi:hypothetical protein